MKIQNETILGSQPKTALARSFPCMLNLLNSSQADLSGMIYHSMASGSHLLALSIGSSIATVKCRRNPSLRQAMTIAITVSTGLFFIFPIRQMITAFGVNCISPFILCAFALLLAGWMVYAFSDKVKIKTASFNTN